MPWGFTMPVIHLYLYLEGLANEVQHILQQCRKRRGLAIIDYVHVGVVQDPLDKLTDAVTMFSQTIKKRVRIVDFSPNPLDVTPESCSFVCSLGRIYIFDVYMALQCL